MEDYSTENYLCFLQAFEQAIIIWTVIADICLAYIIIHLSKNHWGLFPAVALHGRWKENFWREWIDLKLSFGVGALFTQTFWSSVQIIGIHPYYLALYMYPKLAGTIHYFVYKCYPLIPRCIELEEKERNYNFNIDWFWCIEPTNSIGTHDLYNVNWWFAEYVLQLLQLQTLYTVVDEWYMENKGM